MVIIYHIIGKAASFFPAWRMIVRICVGN